MNINFKKVSLALLFATSCLITTAHSMWDEKGSAKKYYHTRDISFKHDFRKEIEQIEECLKKQEKKYAVLYTIKKREGRGNPTYSTEVLSYTTTKILTSLKNVGEVFFKDYFANKDMNSIRLRKGTPFIREEIRVQKGMSSRTSILELIKTSFYYNLCDFSSKDRNEGLNSSHLFNLLDSAIRRIGSKYARLKRNLINIGFSPQEEKKWQIVEYLDEKNIKLDQSQFEPCCKLVFLEENSSYSWYQPDTHFVELINTFKYCKENLEQYPNSHHLKTFKRLLENKIPLSDENIETVMLMKHSIEDEEGSMEEKLKRFNPLVNENALKAKEYFNQNAPKAKEWFKSKYKTEPTKQDILIIQCFMKENLNLTPLLFRIVKGVVEREKEIFPLSNKVSLENLDSWTAEPLTKKHIKIAEHVLEVGFLKLEFPEFKAACYLMMGENPLIVEPTKLEIEATVHLMNLEGFKEQKAPSPTSIQMTVKLMSLKFAKPDTQLLQRTEKILENKPLEKLTREDLDQGWKIF